MIIISSLSSQTFLVKDTVICNEAIVVLSLPEYAVSKVKHTVYDEGNFRDYPLFKGESGLLGIHSGYMTILQPNENPDLLYRFELGNIAETKMYKNKDDLYFRYDKYKKYAITVYFEFIPLERLKEANDILSNIIILPK